jgi:hypothetical protein
MSKTMIRTMNGTTISLVTHSRALKEHHKYSCQYKHQDNFNMRLKTIHLLISQ